MKRTIKLLTAIVFSGLLTLSTPTVFAAESSSAVKNIFADSAANTNSGSNAAEEFLQPDEAFKLDITGIDAQTLRAKFTVAPTYYLYHDRIKFTSKNATISAAELPKGEIKEDPNFGKMEVYHHDFIANIKLGKTNSNTVTIDATYQGCSEKGLC